MNWIEEKAQELEEFLEEEITCTYSMDAFVGQNARDKIDKILFDVRTQTIREVVEIVQKHVDANHEHARNGDYQSGLFWGAKGIQSELTTLMKNDPENKTKD